ncbi:TetR/AcrR family transcriptional regulator [Gilvibacter sp.]|uniref:TetR/AcrR family transcriptional regulator n=1 Tax=Gilvibacter sp. TaxID=2729997 RepID=UPI003F4A5171
MPRTEVFDRADVIQKVQAVFWSKGYNGTSMQDLVDATGLNRSSIYNSFGSKHELFMLSLKTYHKQNLDGIDQMIEQYESPLKVLKDLFEKGVSGACDSENKGCMLVNCTTELANQQADVQHWLTGSNAKMRLRFRNLLEAAQEAGELKADADTDLLAHYLLMSLQGLRVNGLTNQDPQLLNQLVKQIFKNIT